VDDKFKEYLSIRGTAKNTGECMTELFDQIRKHRVNMDGDVCTVMVTTLVLEVLSHNSQLPWFCCMS
jgi:aarF domain-containing kinase